MQATVPDVGTPLVQSPGVSQAPPAPGFVQVVLQATALATPPVSTIPPLTNSGRRRRLILQVTRRNMSGG